MLTNQNVSTQFTTSQKFGTTTYLTSTGVSEVDAHMMKNIEWGAVAYLKQSKYGLGTTDIGLNNYDNKEWANAVMVTSETRDTYMNASTGTTISEEDILAYYVWIPRYKYQLFNVDTTTMDPIEIQVTFEGKNVTKSSGTANGEWLTHPAFTFGTNELKGIWVGKFSTTGSAETPTIKPNI